jgi:two-component system, response regulator YesN
MQKVMIVDDEVIFRDFLRTTIPWAEYNLEICCEARNGVEALELAHQHRPNIALVDINMPFMDGLQLTERLKEELPETAIVLVTGHSEFEYARRALKLGVEDYILKPFSKEELILTLLKLQQDIVRAQEERATLQANLAMLKEGFLNQLISGDYPYSDEETQLRLEGLGLRPLSKQFQVACIEIDSLDQKWNKVSEKLLWKFAVTNILNEIMEVEGHHIVFNGPEGRILCIREPLSSHVRAAGGEQDGYERLVFLIKKYLKFTITVGIGGSHPGYGGIRTSYQEALGALQQKFVLGSDRVIRFEQLSSQGVALASGFISPELNEELLVRLRMNDWDAVRSGLESIFARIREQRLPLDYTYVICMGLVSLCLSYVSESGHPIEDCFGEDFFPYSEIVRMETIDAAAAWIEGLFERAMQYARLHKQTKSHKIAAAARQYIEERYMDSELHVEQVAQHTFINPSYLRAVFKKELGMTITDYLTHTRMQKAKELLARGGVKLSDIAEQIGYNDPAYFSRAFKKYYGYSPSEYENMRNG